MKVAFILNSLSIGGSERKIVNIANRMSDNGWDVSILYISGSNELQPDIYKSITVLKLTHSRESFFNAIKRSFKYITENNIDSVFTVNMYPLLFALGPKIKLQSKLRMISLTNTTHFECIKKKVQMLIYRLALSFSDHIVFGANCQKKIWKNRYLLHHIPSSVIYNGVDTYKFSLSKEISEKSDILRKDLSLESYDCTFCTVAQLRVEKRHIDIIDACAHLKQKGINVACMFVGGSSNEYQQELLERAKKYGVVNNIKFIGQVDDCRPYLAASNCFLLASESETFSNAALEAMSLSLPVLMTNVGGASEMVIENNNGFLFNALDPQSMANKMELIISGQQDHLGYNARKRVTDSFSYQSMIKSYMDIAHHD
ncbi:glycosyltransferase family 4 protein [Grimontia sp. SpTr1]|uniref:glycosyltransferase family 4 protein n=1 Tax=Grimontia sp. SpTr1 TaxID=2995319 RepID=UPI00248C3215|nr:glycosyltransferase family 4 protein [Grimontia sp. SpTr1]